MDKYLEHTTSRIPVIQMGLNQIFLFHSLLEKNIKILVRFVSLGKSVQRSLVFSKCRRKARTILWWRSSRSSVPRRRKSIRPRTAQSRCSSPIAARNASAVRARV